MALPTRLATYRTQIDCMDRAEVNPSGIEVIMADKEKAVRFRAMCYKARSLYRELVGDTLKWADIYITLDGAKVLIQKRAMDILEIKNLDGVYEYESTLELLDGVQAKKEYAKELLARESIVPEHHRLAVRGTREAPPVSLDDINPEDVPPQQVAIQKKGSYAAMGREVILPEGYDPAAPFAAKDANLFGGDDD